MVNVELIFSFKFLRSQNMYIMSTDEQKKQLPESVVKTTIRECFLPIYQEGIGVVV